MKYQTLGNSGHNVIIRRPPPLSDVTIPNVANVRSHTREFNGPGGLAGQPTSECYSHSQWTGNNERVTYSGNNIAMSENFCRIGSQQHENCGTDMITPTQHEAQPRRFMVNSDTTARRLQDMPWLCNPRPQEYHPFATSGNVRMQSVQARMDTFQNWPKQCIVSRDSMAAAGWFFTGPGDRVQCAYCGGAVVDWVEGDTALGEHRRLYPHCNFVELRLHDMLSERVEGLAEIMAGEWATGGDPPNTGQDRDDLHTVIQAVHELGFSESQIHLAVNNLLDRDETVTTDSLTDALLTLDPGTLSDASLSRRLHSIDSSVGYSVSQPLPLRSESRSDSSLTTHGEGSFVGMTQASHEDDPLETQQKEPLTTRSRRPQFFLPGDVDPIAATGMEHHNPQTTRSTENASLHRPSAVEILAGKEQIKQEVKTLNEKMTCKICCDGPLEVLFLPCRHLSCCDKCGSLLRECPICRKRIEETINVFI